MLDVSERDTQIGRNVIALRGLTTQQAIADAMRERGWKWSQATVWSVEQGERPLRLVEAEDLADVLGVPMQRLTAQFESIAIERTLRKCANAYVGVLAAADRFVDLTVVLNAEMAGLTGQAVEEVRRELNNARDHLGLSMSREILGRLEKLATAYTAEADRAVVQRVIASSSGSDPSDTDPQDQGDALGVADVAARMGVSKMAVYRLVHSGKLRAVRVGQAFRIFEQDLEDYQRRRNVEVG